MLRCFILEKKLIIVVVCEEVKRTKMSNTATAIHQADTKALESVLSLQCTPPSHLVLVSVIQERYHDGLQRVQMLLAAGAPPSDAALMKAVEVNDAVVVKLLLDHGANPNGMQGAILMKAVSARMEELRVHDKGSDHDICMRNFAILACMFGKGIDPTILQDGSVVIQVFLRRNCGKNYHVLKMLIDAGALIDEVLVKEVQESQDVTLLNLCAQCGHRYGLKRVRYNDEESAKLQRVHDMDMSN